MLFLQKENKLQTCKGLTKDYKGTTLETKVQSTVFVTKKVTVSSMQTSFCFGDWKEKNQKTNLEHILQDLEWLERLCKEDVEDQEACM